MRTVLGIGLASAFCVLGLVAAIGCTPAEDKETEDNGGSAGATGGAAGSGGAGAAGTAGQGGESGGGGEGGSTGGSGGSGGSGETGGSGGAAGAAGSGGGSAGQGGSSGAGQGEWQKATSPCPGSRTNAMWFDDRQHGFVGCGENAEGKGLFSTTDGGATWSSNVKFEQVRVVDIRRGPDKKLYGAGKDTVDKYSAWLIDESTANLKLNGLFVPGNNAYTKVDQGENIAVAEDGQMLVDSLTGNSAAYKPSGGTFEEIRNLNEASIADPENAPNFQVRRVRAFNNRFFATGSTINEPAQVFLPSKLQGATYHFQPLALQPSTQSGELLDLHIWSATSILAVGFDNSHDYPLLYLLDGDAYETTNWKQVELLDSGITYKGGIWSISVQGDVVVAAGEKIPSNEGGFVVISTDRGSTWKDISPPGENKLPPGPLSKIWLFPNGDIFVAGGGQEAWVMSQ